MKDSDKLIVEFMSWDVSKLKEPISSSWNLLMEVVEKIGKVEDLKYELSGTYCFQISSGYTDYVWVDPPIGDRIYFSGNRMEDWNRPLKEKVYEGIVTFIEYYNKYTR